MNRIMGRARILLILVLVLALGMGFFLGEYLLRGGSWVLFPGSPHIYNAGNIGCGTMTDRDGILLLDLTGGRVYSQNADLRRATVHWLGDRKGNISAPALAHYAEKIAGYDFFDGVYAYGGTGGTVVTSLSARVQIAALEAMGDYAGTVAVYNYQTGELICAVTTPNYDPDNVPEGTAAEGLYLNRFTQSAYTPGSIFKIVTLAAALEAIPDIQEQTFTCNGTRSYGNDKVTCEKAHGRLTLKEAFGRSCNCAFSQIADQLGGAVLQRYAEQFHITDSVSFDGITTATGKLEADGQAKVSVAWSAIGQHKDLVNPCRFMTFLGAIANDGVEVEPHLVTQIRSGIRNSYTATAQSGGRIMSTKTAKLLQEYLRNNVQTYYGDENFPDLSVCAKSGTAEVGSTKKPNAMFAGFLADENLPLAFMVTVEDGGYGKTVGMPIIAKVLAACRQYLG